MKFIFIFFAACAPLDGVPEYIRLRDGTERAGTALRLADGRLIAVHVIKMNIADSLCGQWQAPDTIWLIDDPQHCGRLELLLAHELGHANGLAHEKSGIMAAIPQER